MQLNDLFSLYYQNSVTTAIFTDGSGVGVLDYNSALANLTLADTVDLGLGPSFTVVALSAGNSSGVAVAGGMHARVAVNLGGASGAGPRRRGVSLGVDVHPTFAPGGVLTTAGFTVGYEWF